MKKKYILLIIIIIISALIALATVPIKSQQVGIYCQNFPLDSRVDLITGNTLSKEAEKLNGDKTCPTVQLNLYVL